MLPRKCDKRVKNVGLIKQRKEFLLSKLFVLKLSIAEASALQAHANKMQIKTSPFFASRLYPSITSCDNETNVKTHWGCTFFSYYSGAADAVQVFKCIQLLLCSNHFILKAINCSHLISDPLKCLFLPPSHYFCLANSRHPAVSSTHFKICIDGLTRDSIYLWIFLELCMPPLIYVFENLAKPDTVLKYFFMAKVEKKQDNFDGIR